MTDSLFGNFTPILTAIQEIVEAWWPYFAAIVGAYFGLFLIGLVIEAASSSKAEG